jgi:hypothetical protein
MMVSLDRALQMHRADELDRNSLRVPIANLPRFRATTRQPWHRLKAHPPVLARRPVFSVKRASQYSRAKILRKKRLCAVIDVGAAGVKRRKSDHWDAGPVSR